MERDYYFIHDGKLIQVVDFFAGLQHSEENEEFVDKFEEIELEFNVELKYRKDGFCKNAYVYDSDIKSKNCRFKLKSKPSEGFDIDMVSNYDDYLTKLNSSQNRKVKKFYDQLVENFGHLPSSVEDFSSGCIIDEIIGK